MDTSGLMLRQLHLSIWSFSKSCFSSLDKFQIAFSNVAEEIFKSFLIGRYRTIIISILNKRRWCFNSLNVTEENGISSLWHLSWTLKLMNFKPILLETSLRTVFYWFAMALRTTVKRYELLIDITLRMIATVDYRFQWAHFIFTLG